MPPLKRREELQALSEDHHNGLVIALRCRRLAEGTFDADRSEFWASVVEFSRLQVAPHFGVEEEYLLPALRALGEADMAEKILARARALARDDRRNYP